MARQGHSEIRSFIKTMRKLAKVVKINVFRTLEIYQRLEVMWEVFVQGKQLNLSKNIKLCDILIDLIQSTFSRSSVYLKTKSLPLGWKTVAWWLIDWAEQYCTSFKVLFPITFHDLTYLVHPWKTPCSMLSSFDLVECLPSARNLFPRGVCLKLLPAIV